MLTCCPYDPKGSSRKEFIDYRSKHRRKNVLLEERVRSWQLLQLQVGPYSWEPRKPIRSLVTEVPAFGIDPEKSVGF